MTIVGIMDTCCTEGYVVNDQTFDGKRMILVMPPGSRGAALKRVYEFESNGAETVLVGVVGNRYTGYVQGKNGGKFEVRLT